MKNHLLCCDWGTTSFRLRLVNIQDQEVIGEILSLDGISSTFNSWKNVENSDSDKQAFFTHHLKKQISLLASQLNMILNGITIVVSGMASSSIGMLEIPYANLPFDLDGSQVNFHGIENNTDFPHDLLLISGICSEYDVMRGEETQMIGLVELLRISEKDSILIFPGTHSKHLYIKGNQLVDFQTYMTGEVFKIISSHSILKDSIEMSALPELTLEEKSAFRLGVQNADSAGILKGLFRVRTNQLFNKLNKKENAFYLSGLLIGSEIKHLLDEINIQLVLCSGNNLYELYKLAIEELDLSERTTTVSSEIVDKATIAGQVKIYQNQTLTLTNKTYE